MAKKITLAQEDFDLLSYFVKNAKNFSQYSLQKLSLELEEAIVVSKDKLPENVVRLNSQVNLKIEEENKEINLRLVMPSEADFKANKVSVFTPLGSAIIGYQEGDLIDWEVPGGNKTFRILKVSQTEML
jgi:regulator of nucleoside diphosphate kinase